MPATNEIIKHRENIADLSDRFAIKNFVLSDSTLIPADQSMEEAFIFKGFMLTICLKGEAIIKLNFREFRIGEGMIFSYLPGQIIRVAERSEDLIIENLFLSSDYILQLPLPRDFDVLKNIGREPVLKANPDTLHNMLELHALVAKYHRREDNPTRQMQTRALIFALLMEIGSAYSAAMESPKAVSRREILTDEFFKLLVQNYKSQRNVAFYADKMCLTPKYLSMTVKSVTDHPISEWINQAVVIEAKRMLKATDMTALQISEELNFPNPSFFGKFFKQYAGMTPIQYKNS